MTWKRKNLQLAAQFFGIAFGLFALVWWLAGGPVDIWWFIGGILVGALLFSF